MMNPKTQQQQTIVLEKTKNLNITEKTTSIDNNIAVIDYPDEHIRSITRNKTKIPFFCPICERPMKSGNLDIISYTKYNCCNYCFIDFVEGFEDQWESGFRPDKKQIKNSIKKR